MNPIDIDDEDQQEHEITRSNSWSHTQRPVFLNTNKSMVKPARATGLSCIYETDDNSNVMMINQSDRGCTPDLRNRSKSVSGGQVQTKKRRHSYTELIASAILSSPEKKKTLAEIYDWFVLNVPTFKDQRYMHSSLGWKNAVRHNLSVQTCFKRVKRHGMEKPSWWTVDLSEVSKRRLVLRPTINTNNSGDNNNEAFLPPRRNTYSGPPPSHTLTAVNSEGDMKKINYRVTSSHDLTTSNASLSFTNSDHNAKRTRFPPIRPAVSSTMDMGNRSATFTLGNNGYMTPMSHGHGHSPNTIDMKSDGVFLKPCAVDNSQMGSPHSLNSPTLIPSVTLVCKDGTTANSCRQAQLEVSLFQTHDEDYHNHSSIQSSPASSPCVYNWSQQSTPVSNNGNAFPQFSPGSLSNHFGTWPTIATSESNSGVPPNQTLRVKTVWGNVQDINFHGLLPMRTVVKCDGGTQTEEANVDKSGSGMNSNLNNYHLHHDNNYTSQLTSDLPEDLASLQIEGDLLCDIDEVLGAGLEQPMVNKPNFWSTWNSSMDQFGDRTSNDPFLNVSASVAVNSPFNFNKMDVSEP